MYNEEIRRYQALNDLAKCGGITLFGSDKDKDIPLCELKQAFDLESDIYNRSFQSLSINDTISLFDSCVMPLQSERILLHIGADDLEFFQSQPEKFTAQYISLIRHIRETIKKCDIAIISIQNYENDPEISKMNKTLKYIAQSERCQFGDIATKRVWNPKQTKEISSLVYSVGFMRSFKAKRPIDDLAKILFCFENAC